MSVLNYLSYSNLELYEYLDLVKATKVLLKINNFRLLSYLHIYIYFAARCKSAPEMLKLAQSWDRADIAASQIFVYGQDWTVRELFFHHHL